jgi:hypothetical protein
VQNKNILEICLSCLIFFFFGFILLLALFMYFCCFFVFLFVPGNNSQLLLSAQGWDVDKNKTNLGMSEERAIGYSTALLP